MTAKSNLHRDYRCAKALRDAVALPLTQPYISKEDLLKDLFRVGAQEAAAMVYAYQLAPGLIDGCLAEIEAKETSIIEWMEAVREGARQLRASQDQLEVLQSDLRKLREENAALKEKLAPTPISHAVHAHAMEHWPVVREMWAYANARPQGISMATHLVDVLGLDRDTANFYADTYRAAEGLIGACCAEIDRMREAAEEVPQELVESPSLTVDGEIETIAAVWDLFQDLPDEAARDRVVRYILDRCGIALR